MITVRSAPFILVALVVVVSCAVGAYESAAFWSSALLLLGGALVVGLAIGTANYLATRRAVVALMTSLLATGAHLFLIAAITLSRWEA